MLFTVSTNRENTYITRRFQATNRKNVPNNLSDDISFYKRLNSTNFKDKNPGKDSTSIRMGFSHYLLFTFRRLRTNISTKHR